MSSLFYDTVAHVVKIVLHKKDGSGSSTYYLSDQFYDADELYSGSSITYPILADKPRAVRSFGRSVAILHTLDVNLYGKNYFTKLGESFKDLLNSHEVVGAAVTLYKYYKPLHATGSDADTRQTLTVTDFAWAGDILSLACKDTFFQNKEISKKFTPEVFSTMDDAWQGEYGAIVFGSGEGNNGVFIDAPFYYTAIDGSNKPVAKIFTGWAATSHPMNSLEAVYMRNKHKEFVKDEWSKINMESDPQAVYLGQSSASGATPFSLADDSRAIVITPSTTARVLTHGRTAGGPGGSVGAVDGEYKLIVYYAQYLPSNASYAPFGSPLAVVNKDAGSASVQVGSDLIYFQLQEYVILQPNVAYFVQLEWTNHDDTTNYISAFIKAAGGITHYARDNSESNAGWAPQADLQLTLALYALGFGDDGFIDLYSGSSSPYRYSYFHLESRAASLDTSETRVGWDTSMEWKAAVKGLEDTSSGTYTGSNSSVITNPSDLVRFLLLEDEIGIGGAAGTIDSSFFDSTRTALGSTFNMSFAIDRETQLQDLIPKICRQCRCVFYKLRNGKLSMYYPLPIGPTYGAYLNQGYLQDDLSIEALLDTQEDEVINDLLIPYGPDPLNTPKDAALVRRSGGNSYKAVEYLSGGSSGYTDNLRPGQATDSINMYGLKQYREAFDLFPADSSGPRKTMKYLFDRYHTKQKRVTVRVPVIRYHAKDFWDTFWIAHTDLPGAGASFERMLANNDGDPLTCYYQGVPSAVMELGNLAGECIAIEEDDEDMLITIETVNSFER